MTPTSLSQYDCIFFDFDGVIADSVDAKITAFGALYDEFGSEVRQAVEDYQRAVPGETRFDKIPRFHRDLLNINLTKEEVLHWCDKLSSIVLDEVVKTELLPDVPEILFMLTRRGIPAHIVSGTPHDELQIIVDRKGLGPFFRTARGAPEKKASIVDDIMHTAGLGADQCLFVGDAMTDYNCAVECEMAFLGRVTPSMNPFPQGTRVVSQLGEYFLAEETEQARSQTTRSKAA
ncbi:HAD hydrolase-like protein [Parasphingorhabdus sp.]|uniref:HAD family hydrolase n=1 Tax=Parasphingorhabdus sp. TaxID=2709688 RepID=UPI0032652F2A